MGAANEMTDTEDVAKLVARLAPEPVCAACITRTLAAPDLEHVERLVHGLAGMNGFERAKQACGLCGETTMVIRHN